MDKQIFIINGSGGVGKDTFVTFVRDSLIDNIAGYYMLANYSSVRRVKEIMKDCGWDGISKTEKDRKFMSDLKLLLTEYNDLPFKDMKNVANEFYDEVNKHYKLLFFHIREPEEVARAAKEFNAKTILVKRDSVKHITSNMADENVYNFNYDIVIENNGTLEDLDKKARQFMSDCKNNTLKERY